MSTNATIQCKSNTRLQCFSWSYCGWPVLLTWAASSAFSCTAYNPVPKTFERRSTSIAVLQVWANPSQPSSHILSNPGHTSFLPPNHSFSFFLLCSDSCDHPCTKNTMQNLFIWLKSIIFHFEKWNHVDIPAQDWRKTVFQLLMWCEIIACSCVSKLTSITGIHKEVDGDLWIGIGSVCAGVDLDGNSHFVSKCNRAVRQFIWKIMLWLELLYFVPEFFIDYPYLWALVQVKECLLEWFTDWCFSCKVLRDFSGQFCRAISSALWDTMSQVLGEW